MVFHTNQLFLHHSPPRKRNKTNFCWAPSVQLIKILAASGTHVRDLNLFFFKSPFSSNLFSVTACVSAYEGWYFVHLWCLYPIVFCSKCPQTMLLHYPLGRAVSTGWHPASLPFPVFGLNMMSFLLSISPTTSSCWVSVCVFKKKWFNRVFLLYSISIQHASPYIELVQCSITLVKLWRGRYRKITKS